MMMIIDALVLSLFSRFLGVEFISKSEWISEWWSDRVSKNSNVELVWNQIFTLNRRINISTRNWTANPMYSTVTPVDCETFAFVRYQVRIHSKPEWNVYSCDSGVTVSSPIYLKDESITSFRSFCAKSYPTSIESVSFSGEHTPCQCCQSRAIHSERRCHACEYICAKMCRVNHSRAVRRQLQRERTRD